MEDIKISHQHDLILRSAVKAKLESWQAITDADCEGYKYLKANRDFMIQQCEAILAEITAWRVANIGRGYEHLEVKVGE